MDEIEITKKSDIIPLITGILDTKTETVKIIGIKPKDYQVDYLPYIEVFRRIMESPKVTIINKEFQGYLLNVSLPVDSLYDSMCVPLDDNKTEEYIKKEKASAVESVEPENHNMPQKQAIDLIDKWLLEAEQLPLSGVNGFDAWRGLTDAMRAYKATQLLDLYDNNKNIMIGRGNVEK